MTVTSPAHIGDTGRHGSEDTTGSPLRVEGTVTVDWVPGETPSRPTPKPECRRNRPRTCRVVSFRAHPRDQSQVSRTVRWGLSVVGERRVSVGVDCRKQTSSL